MMEFMRRTFYLHPGDEGAGGNGDSSGNAGENTAGAGTGANAGDEVKIQFDGKEMTVKELEKHFTGRQTEFDNALKGIKNLHPFIEAIGNKDRAGAMEFLNTIFGADDGDKGGEVDLEQYSPSEFKKLIDKVEKLETDLKKSAVDKLFDSVKAEVEAAGETWDEDAYIEYMVENKIPYTDVRKVHNLFVADKQKADKAKSDKENGKNKAAAGAGGASGNGKGAGSGSVDDKAKPGESMNQWITRTGRKLVQPT